MSPLIRHLLSFLVQLGGLGLFLLAVADDSFLFIPIGSDLLMVVLVARQHERYLLYVLAAAVGSTLGVFLLDLVCRKGGEEGLKRLVKPAQLQNLKRRMEQHAAVAVVISCLAPPPFPFGAYIGAASALQYPRAKLLGLVMVSRAIRFALVGWAALYFGRRILQLANSSGFQWAMGIFIAFCLIGSVVSLAQWLRVRRPR